MKKGETFHIDPKPLALSFFRHLSEKDRRLFCGLVHRPGGGRKKKTL